MKRLSVVGSTSMLPAPDEVFWQTLQAECKNALCQSDRAEIEAACYTYKMAVVIRTQNGNAENVSAWLARVRKLASDLSETLEERANADRPDTRRGREQAIGLIDDKIAHHWAVHAGARQRTLGLLYVVTSACNIGIESLWHQPKSHRNDLDALLDRLGAVYERVSGKEPKCATPPGGGKPYGAFINFFATIASRMLPPEVKRETASIHGLSDPAYAVKNWLAAKGRRANLPSLR